MSAGTSPRSSTSSVRVLVQDYATTVTRNASTTPNVVRSAFVTNRNAVVRYFQLHDVINVPIVGAEAALSLAIPANTLFLLIDEDFFGPQGFRPGAAGIAYAWSTNATVYIAGAAAADHDTVILGGR